MHLPTARQMRLFHFFLFLGYWSAKAESYVSPLGQLEDGISLRKVPGLERINNVDNIVWSDQNEEQVQNVFKRFLFHYSKAHNSLGAVQHESQSVHPLMRLSPKLSQRRKQQLVFLKIRAIPEKI